MDKFFKKASTATETNKSPHNQSPSIPSQASHNSLSSPSSTSPQSSTPLVNRHSTPLITPQPNKQKFIRDDDSSEDTIVTKPKQIKLSSKVKPVTSLVSRPRPKMKARTTTTLQTASPRKNMQTGSNNYPMSVSKHLVSTSAPALTHYPIDDARVPFILPKDVVLIRGLSSNFKLPQSLISDALDVCFSTSFLQKILLLPNMDMDILEQSLTSDELPDAFSRIMASLLRRLIEEWRGDVADYVEDEIHHDDYPAELRKRQKRALDTLRSMTRCVTAKYWVVPLSLFLSVFDLYYDSEGAIDVKRLRLLLEGMPSDKIDAFCAQLEAEEQKMRQEEDSSHPNSDQAISDESKESNESTDESSVLSDFEYPEWALSHRPSQRRITPQMGPRTSHLRDKMDSPVMNKDPMDEPSDFEEMALLSPTSPGFQAMIPDTATILSQNEPANLERLSGGGPGRYPQRSSRTPSIGEKKEREKERRAEERRERERRRKEREETSDDNSDDEEEDEDEEDSSEPAPRRRGTASKPRQKKQSSSDSSDSEDDDDDDDEEEEEEEEEESEESSVAQKRRSDRLREKNVIEESIREERQRQKRQNAIEQEITQLIRANPNLRKTIQKSHLHLKDVALQLSLEIGGPIEKNTSGRMTRKQLQRETTIIQKIEEMAANSGQLPSGADSPLEAFVPTDLTIDSQPLPEKMNHELRALFDSHSAQPLSQTSRRNEQAQQKPQKPAPQPKKQKKTEESSSEEEEEEESDLDLNDDVCMLCKKASGELLCCDGICLHSYHADCLALSNSLPTKKKGRKKEGDYQDEKWFCPECTAALSLKKDRLLQLESGVPSDPTFITPHPSLFIDPQTGTAMDELTCLSPAKFDPPQDITVPPIASAGFLRLSMKERLSLVGFVIRLVMQTESIRDIVHDQVEKEANKRRMNTHKVETLRREVKETRARLKETKEQLAELEKQIISDGYEFNQQTEEPTEAPEAQNPPRPPSSKSPKPKKKTSSTTPKPKLDAKEHKQYKEWTSRNAQQERLSAKLETLIFQFSQAEAKYEGKLLENTLHDKWRKDEKRKDDKRRDGKGDRQLMEEKSSGPLGWVAVNGTILSAHQLGMDRYGRSYFNFPFSKGLVYVFDGGIGMVSQKMGEPVEIRREADRWSVWMLDDRIQTKPDEKQEFPKKEEEGSQSLMIVDHVDEPAPVPSPTPTPSSRQICVRASGWSYFVATSSVLSSLIESLDGRGIQERSLKATLKMEEGWLVREGELEQKSREKKSNPRVLRSHR